MSTAAALLAEAQDAGVRLRLIEGGKLKAPATAPPELLARLREHKAELVELLSGNRCTCCGGAIDWRGSRFGAPFGDGTAMHLACYKRAEVERVMRRARNARSPEAMADPAEITIRGVPLP